MHARDPRAPLDRTRRQKVRPSLFPRPSSRPRRPRAPRASRSFLVCPLVLRSFQGEYLEKQARETRATRFRILRRRARFIVALRARDASAARRVVALRRGGCAVFHIFHYVHEKARLLSAPQPRQDGFVSGGDEPRHDDEHAAVPQRVDEHGREQVPRARVREAQHDAERDELREVPRREVRGGSWPARRPSIAARSTSCWIKPSLLSTTGRRSKVLVTAASSGQRSTRTM